MNTSNNDTPSRVRRLSPNLAEWLQGILILTSFLVLAGAVIVTSGWSPVTDNFSVETPIDVRPNEPIAPETLPATARVVGYQVELPKQTDVIDYLLRSVSVLPATAVLLFSLWHLRALIATIPRGEAFTKINAARVRLIGFALVGGWPIAAIAEHTVHSIELDRAGLHDHVRATFNLTTLMVPTMTGMFLLVLAVVFKAGVRMRDDVEGLV